LQALKHSPQCELSVRKSAQAAPLALAQSSFPSPHWHWPSVQATPPIAEQFTPALLPATQTEL
jgi:hypothetical protein